ncbi:DUF2326 domain-containing protein [Nocardia testacea]|uniref:DUF2326 domain-containing protein n=1 Tax=Nocardia testacea TaxID=248551 RepID=UPI003401BA23
MKLISLDANKDSFNTVHFREGLNLIVAERTSVSKATDSRNGLGKTMLFQIIDFCLGGRVDKDDDGLGKILGTDWKFSLDLEVGGERITVSRSLDNTGVLSLAGDLSRLDLGGSANRSMGQRTWTSWLGQRCFGLNDNAVRGEYDPTFRRLIGHFLRFRGDAYISPFETFRKQPPYQMQVDNSFLMGLNWRLAVDWQRWKDRGKALGALGKREVEELAERLGELESQRVRAEAQRRRISEQIRSFEILPEYRAVERRANDLTAQMQNLANEITMNARMLELYQSQLSTEDVEDSQSVIETFREAGIIFGDSLVHSIEKIVEFHADVARNRRVYLNSEVTRIEQSQAEKRELLQRLEDQRKSDLSLLESHGALDEFAQLQQRLGSAAALTETLTQQIEELRDIRKGKAALKVAQVDLQQRTAMDVEQRVSSIASIFEEFSETFEESYGEPADLVVDVGEAGYQFRVSLPRQGSHGVGKFGIFAYDLAIANSWARSGHGPGFLAHDSIVFDGVDERQKASAIRRAIRSSTEFGFQYLLTINSDDLPVSELAELQVDVSQLTVMTLTDASPAGRLLGLRF